MKDRMLWRGKSDGHGWVFGGIIHHEDTDTYFIATMSKDHISYIGCHLKVDPDTVGQCTGLKDKNGKLIFERDVFRHDQSCFAHQQGMVFETYPVVFSRGCFQAGNGELHALVESFRGEIIGNIHDDGHLLEGE